MHKQVSSFWTEFVNSWAVGKPICGQKLWDFGNGFSDKRTGAPGFGIADSLYGQALGKKGMDHLGCLPGCFHVVDAEDLGAHHHSVSEEGNRRRIPINWVGNVEDIINHSLS